MCALAIRLVLTVTILQTSSATPDSCLQGVNCLLPNCFCSVNNISMSPSDIPQIVYFGFDDALNIISANHYRKLFDSDRRNPNGCPISMTLYVQHKYTWYNLVNEFYTRGMEIGVHSVSHTFVDTADKLLYEASQQRENLATKGNVPIEEIIGWRSPNLKTAGDSQPAILQRLGFEYDISLTFLRNKFGMGKAWPYTLDFGYNHKCLVTPCPTTNHSGFWEVPVISMVDYKNEYPCVYVDGCYNRPNNEDDAFNYLWNNFLDYYEGSRTPMGLNMHAAWFLTLENVKAMDRFITQLLTLDDVFIVSVSKMLDWVKNPTTLSKIAGFQSWGCEKRETASRTTSITENTPDASTASSFPVSSSPTTFNNTSDPVRTTNPATTVTSIGQSKTLRWPLPTNVTFDILATPSTTLEMSTFSKNDLARKSHSVPPDLLGLHGPENSPQRQRYLLPSTCVQGSNCITPDCYCRSTESPLEQDVTPQMVYFTIDGRVDIKTYLNVAHLFHPSRKNPNNCNISATLFIPRDGNSIIFLEKLLNMGFELGLRGNHLDAYRRSDTLGNDLLNEISYFKAKLPALNIKGWRSPALKPLGDDQYAVIKSQKLLYDSTLSLPSFESRANLPWPYTLDFKWQERCDINGCPSNRYRGLWEVPVVPIYDYKHRYLCTYADGCMLNPSTEEDTFLFLWKNFQDRYTGNRAPFGVTLRQQWFSHPVYKPNLQGLDKFISQLVTMPEVYVLSIDKIINWMKDPLPLQTFRNQGCND